jgi:hypothetical protein
MRTISTESITDPTQQKQCWWLEMGRYSFFLILLLFPVNGFNLVDQESSSSRGLQSSHKSFPKIYEKDFISCSDDLKLFYSTTYEAKDQKDKEWCQQTMKKYGTVIGKKWYLSLAFSSQPTDLTQGSNEQSIT